MTLQSQIQPGMSVICADGHDHGQVDGIDGDYLRFTGDGSGQTHWLPLSTVDHVDEYVHLNLGHEQVHQQWLGQDPHPGHRQ